MDGQGIRNEDVTDYRHVLVESDTIPVEAQLATIRRLSLPCAAIVHSGAKSVHAIVKIEAGKDLALYRRRIAYLFDILNKNGFTVDGQCKNPARLSRMPGITRGTGKQYLIALQSGLPSWQAWEAAQTAKKSPDAEIALVNAGDWLSTEPPVPDQIFENTLDAGDKLVLIAPSKQRKSFFFLQMMISLAAGKDFMAWSVPVPRKVLLVQFEVRAGHYHRRIRNMCHAMGIKPEDIGDKLKIMNARGIPLESVYATVNSAAARLGIEVIGFDPFYKMHIGDENSAEDIKPLLARFDTIAETTGAAICYVHHDPKGIASDRNIRDRGAGSNVVGRDYDCCFTMTPDVHGHEISLIEVLLRNYAPQETVGVKWDNGRFDQLGDEAQISIQRDAQGRPIKPPPEWYADDAMEAIGDRVWTAKELVGMLRSKLEISKDDCYAVKEHLTTVNRLEIYAEKKKNGRTFYGKKEAISKLMTSGTPEAMNLPLKTT